MNEPWNASPAEIEAWARRPGAIWPTIDWDLAVTSRSNIGLIIQLASDAGLPGRYFFLACMYLFVGDAFRTEFRARSKSEVETALRLTPADAPPYVARWAERTRLLIDGGGEYSYEQWCAGGYAREEEERAHQE